MPENGKVASRPSPDPGADPEQGQELQRLKRRPDFLRVAARRTKWVTPGFILQAAPTPPVRPSAGGQALPAASPPVVRIGFTTSKKVGKAVQRNRARRRLRAVAADVMTTEARAGYDYVLIGRPETVSRPYDNLVSDLRWALKRLGLRR